MTRQKLGRAVFALAALDLAVVVITGGVSLLGPIESSGFLLRWLIAVAALAADFWWSGRKRAALYGYVTVLLVLLPLLHFRGYRLRGDGLSYYAYAHSVAFDFDIDLANQYESLGMSERRGSQPVRETGRARFTFPVGAPLFWVPLIWIAHIGVWLRNAYGVTTAFSGFSDPYFHTVALGSLVTGWLGLLALDRFLRRWFEPATTFMTVAGIGVGTFLAWYLTYHAIYTHTLTFLLITLFLTRWAAPPRSVRDYAVVGLLLGVAACVRWQNGVFGLLVALTFVRHVVGREWRFVYTAGAAFGGALLLGLLPQFITWWTIYNRLYIGVPLGVGYMRWLDPFVTETLFSSRHGLFSWSPLLLFAVVGLPGFIRRAPWIGVPLAGMLFLLTYVNSSVSDWWAGGSFGSRRFDSVLPIFALGLATTLGFAIGLVRRFPKAVVGVLVLSFIVGNALLMEQYRKGRIPVDESISWETAVMGGVEDWFDAFGYPFSFPMNWHFAAKYDRPKTQYDILVGRYLFHSMNNLGGVVELGVDDAPFLGNGWSGLKDWNDRPREVRFVEGPRAGIFVPTDRAEPLRVSIEAAVPPGRDPVPVEVFLNGARIGDFFPAGEMASYILTADTPFWKRINLLELVPADGVVAVDRVRFERLEP